MTAKHKTKKPPFRWRERPDLIRRGHVERELEYWDGKRYCPVPTVRARSTKE